MQHLTSCKSFRRPKSHLKLEKKLGAKLTLLHPDPLPGKKHIENKYVIKMEKKKWKLQIVCHSFIEFHSVILEEVWIRKWPPLDYSHGKSR